MQELTDAKVDEIQARKTFWTELASLVKALTELIKAATENEKNR